MPKQSKKSKSKRLTLRAKNKVIKKVKEHHKKKRKELKKSGRKEKAPKDPGLPSQWPFKEDLVKEFAMRRAKILADEAQKKDENKQRRMVREHDSVMLVSLRAAAAASSRHEP
jgi:nuclear GTP-binding protein